MVTTLTNPELHGEFNSIKRSACIPKNIPDKLLRDLLSLPLYIVDSGYEDRFCLVHKGNKFLPKSILNKEDIPERIRERMVKIISNYYPEAKGVNRLIVQQYREVGNRGLNSVGVLCYILSNAPTKRREELYYILCGHEREDLTNLMHYFKGDKETERILYTVNGKWFQMNGIHYFRRPKESDIDYLLSLSRECRHGDMKVIEGTITTCKHN